MAFRLCPCRAPVLEVGPRCRCGSCGRRTDTWLVADDTGAVVGAGASDGIYFERSVVIEALGIRASLLST